MVNCLLADRSDIYRWRAMNPTHCFTGLQTAVGLDVPEYVAHNPWSWRASILCYSGTPFAHSRDTICATDSAATLPVDGWHPRTRASPHSGYRSRRA